MGITIKETQKRLRNKETTPEEVVSDFLSLIKDKNKEMNVFLDVFQDTVQEMKEKDPDLPLYGAVFGIKDNILIKGKRCTAGSKILENYNASFDATVIEKIKEKGGVFIGKTNMDEFAMGSSTENSGFGPTRNPYDLERVPGGSSGGSAVAVSAGMCNTALGSDTGGSVRQPAAFCGVVGFKPTYGAISRSGVISMASSFDQVGVFANTVEDTKLVFDSIRGKDERDSVTVDFNGGLAETKKKDKIVVGVPKEYFVEGISSQVKESIEEALSKIKGKEIELVDISLPHTEYALPVYEIIMASEVSSNLARYDGVRYGREDTESAMKSIEELYMKNRGKGLGTEAKRRVVLGTYTLSSGYYDAYYIKAQKVRALIIDDFKKAFQEVDAIITPTTPTLPFKIGEKIEDPLTMHLSDIFTVTASISGLPAISIPCAKKNGLPVGVQLIGDRFKEELLFNIAEKFEKIWQI
ncbi:MAG: Asp-tRNA(Asn)/Glu-tRNA(Gln) amidotransferase subunit GatA [Candidatus Pacebacteria bacterium]|nr:Asp-tRNA(Asn)/Glu-tRNA(Gln) amidotransferase subunit GatA [Candidatus Paceibacterota bacterium]